MSRRSRAPSSIVSLEKLEVGWILLCAIEGAIDEAATCGYESVKESCPRILLSLVVRGVVEREALARSKSVDSDKSLIIVFH